MENKILKLIKSSIVSDENYKTIVKIFKLYEQLQYATNLKHMSEDIFDWLHREYKIDNVVVALFDINKNSREEIFTKGEEFYLDDDYSFFFIINTHTSLNATVSFSATSKVHYEIIKDNYDSIEAAFFQISPIVQNGILKKNYVESSSLDSVTNVYNRNYLVENLTKHLSLSKNKSTQIFMLMIGIDHFKAVIDEFNYDIGDKVLIELAKVIHSNISQFDMVGRLSGDEFLVTILSTEDDTEINQICNKIINDFANVGIIVDEETKQVLKKTVCIGFDKYIVNSTASLNDTIKNADIALYEAKNKGRSQLFDFSDLKEEDTIDLF